MQRSGGLLANGPRGLGQPRSQALGAVGTAQPGCWPQSFLRLRKGEAGAHSLDMFLMVLCSFMAFSQSVPLNSSTTTLRTVPSSRQCGAIPGGGDIEKGPGMSDSRHCAGSWANPHLQQQQLLPRPPQQRPGSLAPPAGGGSGSLSQGCQGWRASSTKLRVQRFEPRGAPGCLSG